MFLHVRSYAAPLALACCSLAILLTAQPAPAQQDTSAPAVVQVDPPRFGFFTRMLDCDGIPVRGPAQIQDNSLQLACTKVRLLLHETPGVRQRLVAEGAELQLIALNQDFKNIPGHENDPPRPYIDDIRSRELYATCSEKNLLAVDKGDNTIIDGCMFGFAAVIFEGGMEAGVRMEVLKQFQTAKTAGLWKGGFASLSADSYWASLSLWYFGERGRMPPGKELAPGPAALAAYDPAGFALLKKLYSGKEQPGRLVLTNARPVSTAEPQQPAISMGELLVVNDTRARLLLYRIAQASDPSGFGLGQKGTYKSELMPFDRRMFFVSNHDTWVVSDEKGKELGRYTPFGAVSTIHIEK